MRDDVPGHEYDDDYLRKRISSSDYIFREARDAGVRLVRCLWADLSNIVRGRSIHVNALRRHLIGGASVPAYSMALTTGDAQADVRLPGKVALVPDPSTFRLAPYAPNTAVMLGELYESDQQPWALCPRSFLKRMIADLADAGLRAQVGVEVEFYFGTRNSDGSYTPVDDSAYASSLGMLVPAKVINDVVGALDEQRIALEHYHPESGGGQQELTLAAADPLAACDRILFTRETVRAIGWAHGWYASFMPKPFEHQPGSGLHLHLSLWDRNGDNVTVAGWHGGAAGAQADAQAGEAGLRPRMSDVFGSFTAGVMLHLPGLSALACPTTSSYRRLQPEAPLPPYAAWGYDNLQTLVRQVPLSWSDPLSSANVEFKFADPSANPYLMLGGLLAAGLDGIINRLAPIQPIDGSPQALAADERSRLEILPLPASLTEACDALADDGCLGAALGTPLLEAYLGVKRREARMLESASPAAEQSRLFWKF